MKKHIRKIFVLSILISVLLMNINNTHASDRFAFFSTQYMCIHALSIICLILLCILNKEILSNKKILIYVFIYILTVLYVGNKVRYGYIFSIPIDEERAQKAILNEWITVYTIGIIRVYLIIYFIYRIIRKIKTLKGEVKNG